MKRFFTGLSRLCVVAGLLLGSGSVHAIGIWHRDYASGLAEAQAEQKDLLIVFTGTDWIEICEKFHDEILSEPEFIDAVSPEYALVKLEYPKDGGLPREEAAQKALLREAYRVRGFPTVVLTDASGRPYGLNGYQPAAPREYADQILGIKQVRSSALAAAEGAAEATGRAKAEKIALTIPDLPGPLLVRFFQKEMEAVLAADPADELKLGSDYRLLLAEASYSRQIQELAAGSQWAEMIALTDQFITENGLQGERLQAALINRAGFERRAGRIEKSLESLQQAEAIDPESEPGREAAALLKDPRAAQAGPDAGNGEAVP